MTPDEIERLLTEGETHHVAGNLEAAELSYRRVHEAAPQNPDALQLLGTVHMQRGDLETAIELLTQALSLEQRNAVAHVNLAACHMNAGRPHEALPHAKKAAELAPRAPDAWRQLSVVAAEAGRVNEAAEALGRLLELTPDDRRSAVRRTAMLIALNRLDDAEAAVAQLERTHPLSDEAFDLRTKILAERRDWHAMLAAAKAWLKFSPDNEAARDRLSQAYLEAGNLPAAVETYRPLVAGEPVAPERALAFGRICLIAQNFREAEQWLKIASGALPESAEAAYSMGRLYTFLGDLEAAEEASRRAIDLDPDSVRAYVQLTTIRGGRMDPDHVTAMERLWDGKKAPDVIRATLGMSLADIHDKKGEPDKAFQFYSSANELNRAHFAREEAVYDPREQEGRTERLMALFRDMPPPERGRAEDGLTPIFIVGMPRSGTTLLESILAAHSEVYGAGEALTGARLLDSFLLETEARPNIPAREIIERNRQVWRKAYLNSLPESPDGERVVTDKLPTNFLGLGLLAQLFPEAHFIHSRRDALDTCWSIFRHSFPRAYRFAHRLEDIGHYYGEYRRLMEFWDSLFGGRLHTVVYEDLTAGAEEKSRELVEFCGLEWEAGCLDFHEKKRAIATFSSVQVRAPISSSSIGAAERYRRHLGPLIAALESSKER